MDVTDRVVVVTGGASGIGRALCRAVAARGARAIVVADIDGPGAEVLADELGERAAAVRTDMASSGDVSSLVEFAESTYGAIDIFFANAGIIVAGGVEVPDDAWERIWHVNVMSHVLAARALLPGMLARGEGHIVITASAAGLLTQLGSAPYSVTKHAAVALAEWLAITHHDAGIRVSCLCPQGVWTNMTGGGQRRDVQRVAQSTAGRDGFLEADEVAEVVLAAVAEERFLILPHPEVATYEHRRADDRERWLTGMRRVQATLRPRA